MAAVSKPKKPQRTAEDVELIKSDVANFASSLGLAPPTPSTAATAGFDDTDFRKPAPIKAPKPPRRQPTEENNRNPSSPPAKSNKKKPDVPAKPHPLHIDPFTAPAAAKSPASDLPLMKASALSGQWYADAAELEAKVFGPGGTGSAAGPAAPEVVARKKEVGERLLEQYARDYESSRRKSGDMRLLEMTARSGTSADKVSAFTCLVEDNPIANIRPLDGLLSMVTSKVGKRYAFTGFEALKELFLMRLLPDRKLKCLFQRPLDRLPETKDGFSLLLFWYWEECLKQRYERFVIALEDALKDMLPNLKDRAMKTLYILLKSKSEQERRLLTALVNKLGDPERKWASNAGYHLSCLLSTHPNMKTVVIDEVDSFIFRPHIGLRAKYQAVNFLSQILLSKKGDGPKIAKRLVDVYFALFKVLLSVASDPKKVNKHGKYETGNGRSGKTSKGKRDKVKATSTFQSAKKEHPVESNVEMDSRLLSALLTGVNRAFPFVSSDEADDIIEVQTPILFKLVHSENFNVGVQALMLLYQISCKNQIASDRFYRALYSILLSPASLNSSKPEMFLGLLVKAMKNDINLKRVSAFAKRILQVALQRPPQYACGCLFLLSEVLKAKPPLWMLLLQNESADDDLEHFEDIVEDPESAIPPSNNLMSQGGSAASENDEYLSKEDSKSVVAVDLDNESRSKAANGVTEQAEKSHAELALPGSYNPRHREPSYCNADRVSWWELSILASHVHPSVATMAQTLLSGANIVYNGDPINDLSLNAFLDKFMEKKPKPNKKAEGRWHGGSQIAPARKLDTSHHLIGDEILQLAEEEVSPEDVVFHRFYVNKTGSSKKAKKKKSLSHDEDAEDILPDASDESEGEMDNMLDSGSEDEIDNVLGSRSVPLEEDKGEYDYDDLDRVAAQDDDDLLGNDSDTEAGSPSEPVVGSDSDDDGSLDILDADGEDSDDDDDARAVTAPDDVDDDDDDDILDGSGSDEFKQTNTGKKRKKNGKKPSPFASLEEYEHLMTENGDATEKSKSRKKSKKRKASV